MWHLTLKKNDRGVDPANCAKVYCALASLENFKGILGILEFSSVDTPAAPGWHRRNRVSLFRSAARHSSTGSVFGELLEGRVDKEW